MENRVYYGEYSLKRWVELILQGKISLPKYQRYFVWSDDKVKTLIDTFKKHEFIPPVTIGAFKTDDQNQNLILDGQQRLTSIFLAYIGFFPDKEAFKKQVTPFANENDEDIEEEALEQFDNILSWTFDEFLKKGRTKEEIIRNINKKHYKEIEFDVTDEFLKKTFLGFCYLVPYTSDIKEQQKYYSSVFRNINIQGQPLHPQESRASLYYLDTNLEQFFDPEFCKTIKVGQSCSEAKLDFVRYLSLLSQYHKDEREGRVARGYRYEMEKYYVEYIYSIVGECEATMFAEFSTIFPDKNFAQQFENIKQKMSTLSIPLSFPSVIDADMYFFGLIYMVVFKCSSFDVDKADGLKAKLNTAIEKFKNDGSHSRTPSAFMHLRNRLAASIEIYKSFIDE